MTSLTRAALGVWFLGSLLVGASLLAPHLVSLPVEAAAGNPAGEWRVQHYLSTECGCSKRILQHLAERDPISFTRESIVVIGEDLPILVALHEKGYALAPGSSVESVPQLVVTDPSGIERYRGGYTQRPRGPVILDTEIIAATIAGHERAALPLFGCATSAPLRSALDPFGVMSLLRKIK